MKKFDEAIADFRTAMKMEPHKSEYLRSITDVLMKSGKLSDVVESKNTHSNRH